MARLKSARNSLRSFNAKWANARRPKIERNVLVWQAGFAVVVVLMMFQVVYGAG